MSDAGPVGSDPGPPPGPAGDDAGSDAGPVGPDSAEGPAPAESPTELHGALAPRGEDVAWSALGTLLGGPITWGGIGWLLDRWLGTSPLLTAIGVVVGSLTAFGIVYLRFGRDGHG